MARPWPAARAIRVRWTCHFMRGIEAGGIRSCNARGKIECGCMSTTPFPRKQIIVPLRPGSYIALSKAPLHTWAAPAGGAPPDAGHPDHPWLAPLTQTLNRALGGLNGALLQANALHAQGADAAVAMQAMNESLTALDSVISGLFWPPVRPPFRGREDAGDAAESDQFPLAPGSLPPDYHGYVTFRCDLVPSPHSGEPASWGFVTSFSVVFYPASEGDRREPSSEVVRDISSERRRDPGPSDRRRESGSSTNLVAAGSSEPRREPDPSDRRREPGSSSLRSETGSSESRREPDSSINLVAAGSSEPRREPDPSDRRRDPGSSSLRRDPGSSELRREPVSITTLLDTGSSERRRESGSSDRRRDPGSSERRR